MKVSSRQRNRRSKSKRIGESARPHWDACAKELDLRYYRGTAHKAPQITGDIDGFRLFVTLTDCRRGDAEAFTYYQIEYRSAGVPIRITSETALTRTPVLRRMIDVKDLKVGDRQFDKLALIDAESVEAASQFLTDRRRQLIGELLGMRNLIDVIVTDTHTAFRTKKLEDSAGRLTGNILGLIEFARIMGNGGNASVEFDMFGELVETLPETQNTLPPVNLTSFFDADPATPARVQDTAS